MMSPASTRGWIAKVDFGDLGDCMLLAELITSAEIELFWVLLPESYGAGTSNYSVSLVNALWKNPPVRYT